MPHDGNGTPIKKGDRVMISFEVLEVSESPEFCNMHVKPVQPMPGENAYQGTFWLNTTQGVLIWRKPEESEPK